MTSTPPADKAADKPAAAKPPKKDALLDAAQALAPHVTREFLDEHGLGDDYLERIARGEEPPPPYIGPEPVVDLHLTAGGWQITPKGVKPGDAGKDAISR